jgi:hypothetical protein
MPFRLENLRITAIAAVDDPDNPPAEILLFKRRQDSQEDKTAKDEDGKTANNQTNSRGREGKMKKLADLGLTDEQLEAIQKMEAEVAESAKQEADKAKEDADKAAADLKAAQDELATLKAKDTDKDTDVQKRIDDLEKRTKEAEDKAKESDARVAKMEDEQRTAEAEEKVGEWKYIPGATVKDHAPVVKAVRASAPGKAEELEALLDAANAAIKQSQFLTAAGKDGSGGSDTVKRVDELVTKKMEANPKLSKAQAEAQVWDENPELLEKYREGGN